MRSKLTRTFLALTIFTLLLAACQPGLTDQDPYPLPPATQALATLLARGVATGEVAKYPAPIGGPMAPTPTPAITAQANAYPAPQATLTPEEPAALLASRHFLAGRLGLMVRKVRLLSWEEATWISPNLGCQPEVNFDLQTPPRGYRITLRAGGRVYVLHSDQAGEFICMIEDTPSSTGPVPSPAPGLPASIPTGLPSQQAANILHAIDDLAKYLNAAPAEISFIQTYSDEFPASNLGCPVGKGQPQPIPALISGQVIILGHRAETYTYHARGNQVIFCGQE